MNKGQQVTGHINNHAGRIEFAGEVVDVTPSGRQAMVTVACTDGVERYALAENVTPAATNLKTHTNAVHAPGRHFAAIRGAGPKCCASATTVMRFHYIIPTSEAVTCKRCLAALAKEAAQ